MYLSRRYFNERISYEQYHKIIDNYSDGWECVKTYISESHPVTVSAIRLSEKIKKELDIDVFPLIRTCAIKGYKHDGQMQFFMIGKGEYNLYYFDCPRKFYDLKSSELELTNDGLDKVITIKNF